MGNASEREYTTACLRCKGEGIMQADAWHKWADSQPVWTENGWNPPMPAEPEEIVCPECHGFGRVPTIAGMRILKKADAIRALIGGDGDA
jgi:hypothetical protein